MVDVGDGTTDPYIIHKDFAKIKGITIMTLLYYL